MKDRLILALKNLSRYRRRTIITGIAVAVGLAIYLIADSLLLGLEMESELNLIRYETSSAKVLTEAYWDEYDELPLEDFIANPDEIVRALEEEGVPATPRVTVPAELVVYRDPYPEDGSIRTRLIAIEPDRDDRVFSLQSTVSSGRYLQADENGVLLGAWLADNLGAEAGYPITIVTRTRGGFYQTMDMEIVGILNTPNPIVNRSGVYIPYRTADTYLQLEGTASEIAMHLPAYADAEQRASEIQAALREEHPNLVVRSWNQIATDFVALAEAKSAGSGIILFLVFVIAAVGISNTMLMAVFERVREIGMLRALGMKDTHIWQLFLFEAAGIGLLGAIAGIGLGAAGVAFLVNTGIDYTSLFREMDMGYRSAGIMRGTWNPEAFVQAFMLGVALAVVMAVIPARRALRMDIPSALRYQ